MSRVAALMTSNVSRTLLAVFTASVLLTAALAGCVDSAKATGTLALFVKDAPADEYDQIFVTFTEVSVKNETKWLTIMEGEETIDLRALSDPLAKAQLGLGDLEPGQYKNIRVTVKEAKGVANGTDTLFKVPSGVLKLKYTFDIVEGEETQIVLDFDLSQSVVARPGGDPIFKPVVKAIKDNRKDKDNDGTVDIDDADTEGDAPEQDVEVDEKADKDGKDGAAGGTASPYEDEYAPTSNFALRVKDAPTDVFSEVHVVMTSASVRGADGNVTSVLENASLDYDLRALSGTGVSALLAESGLPAGNYTAIMFTVSESYGIMKDGSRVEFKNPSGKKTVKHAFEIGGELTEITIDIDLDKALVEAGKSGKWIFTPQIKKVMDKKDAYKNGAEDDGDVNGDGDDVGDESEGGNEAANADDSNDLEDRSGSKEDGADDAAGARGNADASRDGNATDDQGDPNATHDGAHGHDTASNKTKSGNDASTGNGTTPGHSDDGSHGHGSESGTSTDESGTSTDESSGSTGTMTDGGSGASGSGNPDTNETAQP